MMRRVLGTLWGLAALFLAALTGGCVATSATPNGEGPPADAVAPAAPSGIGEERLGEPPPTAGEEALAYTTVIEGVDDGRLLELLRESSLLVALEDRPPASRAALRTRIEGDRERLDTVLRSEGYYDARIDVAIDEEQTPPVVRVSIVPGPPYRFEDYRIVLVGEGPPPPSLPLIRDLGVVPGEVAQAKAVVDAQTRLIRHLSDSHRPLARIVDRQVIVDHGTQGMRVTVEIDAGPPVRFGPLTVIGHERTEEDYVRALIPWQQGDPYRQSKVDLARQRLLRTGLFDAVIVETAEEADAGGELPMTITLVERSPRSISVAANFSTTEGFGGDVSWEHRNLFGSNEKLVLRVEGNRITQKVGGILTRPNWRQADRDLLLTVTGTRTDSKAFNELGGEVSARVRSPLVTPWFGSLGTSMEGSRIKDTKSSRTLLLFGLPASLVRDDTVDKLDPRSGSRFRWQATPFTGYFNKPVTFLQNTLTASAYQPLDGKQRFVLAGRVKAGSLLGEKRESIPANKRFYAGGGDSVRGYAYQKIGPLDDDNDPIGGRSLFEFSTEVRARVWGNFGVVAFVDGGAVFPSVLPSFDETIRFGAGPGLRYLTPIGPVRFDVAFPLNGRSDIDDPYEFYISIGQAF